MKKLFISLGFILVLTACAATNPPQAPQAQGNWERIPTTFNNINFN